jgi:hypothetical protein
MSAFRAGSVWTTALFGRGHTPRSTIRHSHGPYPRESGERESTARQGCKLPRRGARPGAVRPCRPGVISRFWSVQLQDEVGEAVYDVGLSAEAWRGVDHAEHPEPRHHAVKRPTDAMRQNGVCRDAVFVAPEGFSPANVAQPPGGPGGSRAARAADTAVMAGSSRAASRSRGRPGWPSAR